MEVRDITHSYTIVDKYTIEYKNNVTQAAVCKLLKNVKTYNYFKHIN